MAQLPLELSSIVKKSFESLELPFPSLKHQQEGAVMAFLQGRDVFVGLPTGFGKTIIPALLPRCFDLLHGVDGSIILIISPLIALMVDQSKRFCEMDLTCGSVGESEEMDKKILDGKYQIVISSPEAILQKPIYRSMLLSDIYQRKLAAIVVDEAHSICKW